MSFRRRLANAGHADRSKLPRGPNGNVLCRWCSKETDSSRKNFCGPVCIHEWKLRSNVSYARAQVKLRDKGICAICGVDTYKISKGLRAPLKDETHDEWVKRKAETRAKYGMSGSRLTYWDLDHKVPVAEGGGEAGLDLLQTLCVPCHKAKTKDDMVRIRAKRAQGKK